MIIIMVAMFTALPKITGLGKNLLSYRPFDVFKVEADLETTKLEFYFLSYTRWSSKM